MKRFTSLLFAVVFLSFASLTQAGHIRLDVVTTGIGVNCIYEVSLTGLTEADQVTALSVEAVPGDGNVFLNYSSSGSVDFVPRPAGDMATFVNAFLRLPNDPPLEGEGWAIFDGSINVPAPSGPTGIGFAASNPPSFLVANPLFLLNLMLPKSAAGGSLVVKLADKDGLIADGGTIRYLRSLSDTSPLCIPEPSTLALASIGLIGLADMRRRRAA